MFSRKANIDLESQYGLVTIGRQPTAFFAAFPKADALGIASGGIANVQSNLVNSGRTGNGMLSAQTGPMNPDASINAPGGLFAASYSNGIGYKTPTISGFTGNFFYGFAPASPVTGSNDWEPQSQKTM
jgi:predicted porin